MGDELTGEFRGLTPTDQICGCSVNRKALAAGECRANRWLA